MRQRDQVEMTVEGRIVNGIFAAVRVIASEVRRAGAALQLTVPQFSTLGFLAHGDMSVGELAKSLRVAMPTVTQSTDSLVARGLVERYTDDKDRRQVRLRITPEGRTVFDECFKSVEGYLAQVLTPMPSKRKEDLARSLDELNQGLEIRG